jgi:hypothetical protein
MISGLQAGGWVMDVFFSGSAASSFVRVPPLFIDSILVLFESIPAILDKLEMSVRGGTNLLSKLLLRFKVS